MSGNTFTTRRGGKRDCKTLEVMTVNVVRRCETVDSGTSFVFCFFLETSPPALFGSACWKHAAAAAASSGDLFKALPAADAVLQVKHAGCCDNKCRPVTTIKLTHPELRGCRDNFTELWIRWRKRRIMNLYSNQWSTYSTSELRWRRYNSHSADLFVF